MLYLICISKGIIRKSSPLVAKILVLKGAPVGDEQTVRVVFGTWNVLYLAGGNDGASEITAPSFYILGSEVLELSGMVIKLYAVALDGTNGR